MDKNQDDLEEQIEEEMNEDWDTPEIAERVITKPQAPSRNVSKEEWDRVIKRNFPEFWPTADIVMGAIGQLLLKDVVNPFGLVLVDLPSSGKTMILNFFSEVTEFIYTDDKFTPASFVSHAANRSGRELNQIDLLPKIKDKIMIVRDLAPLFSLRTDDLTVSMGLLTRVFDGEGLETSSGVHGKRGYKGTYMFIFLAASTPIDPTVWKTMSTLGSRLFFLNLGSKEKNTQQLAEQLVSKSAREKEIECRKITTDFVRTLWQRHSEGVVWDHHATKRKNIELVSRMAKLLAKFRGTVLVSKDSDTGFGTEGKIQNSIPLTEQPDRINQLLYNFVRGHAVANYRTKIVEDDVKVALKVVMDSVPYHRARLFKHLIRNEGELNSEQVEHFLGCSRPTALKEMKVLVALGLATESHYGSKENNRTILITEIKLVEGFSWLLNAKRRWPELFSH